MFLSIAVFIESYSVCNELCSVSIFFNSKSYILSLFSILFIAALYSASAIVIAVLSVCSVISLQLEYINVFQLYLESTCSNVTRPLSNANSIHSVLDARPSCNT